MHLTYRTKIDDKSEDNKNALGYLEIYANYFGMIERKLYVDIVYRKQNKNILKKEYIRIFGITARQFN